MGGVTVALAIVLAAAYGPGYAGYDAAWSLLWGSQIAGGGVPGYESSFAPTPHPLANLIAAPLSLLPDGGEGAFAALTFLAFAALVVGVAFLSASLFGPLAGIIGALVVATRPVLARESAFGSVDLPFLALLVTATAVEARHPRAGTPVLVLLALAGLLRPEAWLLSIAYLVWLVRAEGSGRSLRLAWLAACGPVLWAISDLIATGDPLYSLTGTRELGEELARPSGLGTAMETVPRALRELLGTPVLLGGLAGAAVAAVRRPRRAALPLAIFALGLLAFLGLGAAGLPVLPRYLLVPVVMLAVLAGAAPAMLARRDPFTIGAGVVVLAALAWSAPATVRDLGDARSFTADRGRAHRDLIALTGRPTLSAAARRCPALVVPDFRSRPVVALGLDRDPDEIAVGLLADGAPGLLITYSDEHTRYVFNLGAPGETPRQPAPAGSRPLTRNRSWVAYERC